MRPTIRLLSALLIAAVAAVAMQATYNTRAAPVFTEFRATLLQSNEVPPVAFTGAFGSAQLLFNQQNNQLSYHISVSGIPNATMAHIHKGAIGVNGPIIITLLQSGQTLGPGADLTGVATLTPAQVADLFSGNYYVNVHTAAHPGGEIRGQLGSSSLLLGATLSGANEAPPVNTQASGSASFDVNVDTGKTNFEVKVRDIQPVMLTHIHEAPAGLNGPIIFDLKALGGGTLSPQIPLRGTFTMTPTQILKLLSGRYYVNVHTAAQPAGEIRGQIGPQQRFLTYHADLNGASEVPPVTTNGSGVSSLVLDTNTKQLTFKLTVWNVTGITQAHIHAAPVGVNGGVVITLCGPPPNTPPNPAPPPCNFTSATPSLTGTLILNDAQVDALTTGGFYLNTHTPAHPGGEIRGQIFPFAAPRSYLAQLSGNNEVPPLATNASGTASLALDDTQTQLSYTVWVSNITNVVASHIHRGALGVNGPIVISLCGTAPTAACTLAPGTPLSGVIDQQSAQRLRPSDLNDLLLGDFYINVHTSAQPAGEIRGQIKGVASTVFVPVVTR